MKKIFVCISLICAGLILSCSDKNEEVDEEIKPSWLGESIYTELQNPNQERLVGTFNTYLRLVDDLGYATTLSRTGSKTIFPANDEAFQRFFQSNSWGVGNYEQLSLAQKKLLLYSTMLDNALLVNMLSNVSNSTTVDGGLAIKHQTSVSLIDSVRHIYGVMNMPRNNHWWTKYYDKGIDVVTDGTRPMMVHFTREQMVNNSITTIGENSDFQILTGEKYDADNNSAYIFNNKIIRKDVTCQNGYIHQLDKVLVPPGNMAEMLRSSKETSLFSRMVDYYAAPYFSQAITNQYNDWALANGAAIKDSIFELRYVSSRSQNAALTIDPDNNALGNGRYLKFDLGWNQYYPAHGNVSSIDYTITDMGALFAPSNDALKKYFLPGGAGAYLIDIYGAVANTEENLEENLDSMQSKNPSIITSFIRNLQQSSFVETVPSKFPTIINDASENMGVSLSMISRKDDKYNIKIANNGIIYVTNELIAPDEYRAVLAPSSSYPDMYVMNWAVQDRSFLSLDFKYYLLAMSANYAFFIPDDAAFETFYIDPTSLKNDNPRALRFYKYVTNVKTGTSELRCDVHRYNVSDGSIGTDIIETVRYNSPSGAKYTSQLVDILNYHTLLLADGETIGKNHYYKTKHGGTVYISGNGVGATIGTSAQIDKDAMFAPSKIKVDYSEANGHAYRIDHVIQAPQKSVSRVLQDNNQFSEFYELCSGFAATDLLLKAGISDKENDFKTTEQDQYTIFTSAYGTGTNKISNACLDENVKMFNTYNYTLYAPDNHAMEIAYQHGLPRWKDIQAELESYESAEDVPEDVMEANKLKIKAIRDFCRYHFQTTSLYADKTIEGGFFESLCSNAIGMAEGYTVTGGDKKLTITDGTGSTHVIEAGGGHLVNQMARDYWFNSSRTNATSIVTSSFCAVHETSTPFYLYKDSSGKPSWDPKVVAAYSTDAKKLAAKSRRR